MLKAKDGCEIIGVKNLTTNSSYLDLNLPMLNPVEIYCGAYIHEGKLIVLIVFFTIIDAGPARRLIP